MSWESHLNIRMCLNYDGFGTWKETGRYARPGTAMIGSD